MLLLVCVVTTSVGCGLFLTASVKAGDPGLSAQVGKWVQLRGVVSDEPAENETATRVTVSVTLLNSKAVRATGVIFSVSPYMQVNYGDEVTVSGLLEKPEAFATENGGVFLYDKYLAVRGVFFTLMRPTKFTVVNSGQGNFIKSELLSCKRGVIARLESAIVFPESRLAAGLTVAGKQALPADVLADFTRSGTIQVVVLSGYNVTIVAELVVWLCSRFAGFLPQVLAELWLMRFLTGMSAVAGIVLFCIMAGGSATIVRGGIMAVAAIAAKLFSRRYNAFRAFWFSAAVMLIFNPLLAAYDPSFQYSFVATAGLLYLSPWCLKLFSFLPKHFDVQRTAAATLATQLAVLPLALYEMGQVSVVALPANLLLFLVTPVTMFASFIVAATAFLWPFGATLLGWADWLLLAYQLWLVHVFASIPLAFWNTPPLPLWIVGLIYFSCTLVLCILYRRASGAKQTTSRPPENFVPQRPS